MTLSLILKMAKQKLERCHEVWLCVRRKWQLVQSKVASSVRWSPCILHDPRRKGYVAVGTVTREAVPLKDAIVTIDGQKYRLLDCELEKNNFKHDLDDPEMCEYVVTIDWIKAFQSNKPIGQKGFVPIKTRLIN